MRRAARIGRGALAGAVAAAAWSAAEVPLSRALGHGFTDQRLLGRMITSGARWRAAGLVAHIGNGAIFGAVFGALGRGGVADGLALAGVELAATWPGMAVLDRLHPDRRSGAWPRRLLVDRRVIAQEAAMHALFGLGLGALTTRSGATR